MRTAAKVFIIIGMVFGFYMIVPIIVGIIALNKMNYTKPSTAMCIVVLLFCNVIGGILLLCSDEKEYLAAMGVEESDYLDDDDTLGDEIDMEAVVRQKRAELENQDDEE